MNRLKQHFFTLVLLALFSTATQASTLRCGTSLISLGDRGFEILKKCGEPAYRDDIGYTVGNHNRLELRVEEWVYGPRNGMLYILRLEGNRLVNISSHRAP